jgi:hypothetical protein
MRSRLQRSHFALAVLAAIVLATPAAAQRGASTASDFAGEWEFTTDDGTYSERLELVASGDRVRGRLAAYKTGYYTKRTTQEGEVRVEGTVQGNRLALRLIDPTSGNSVEAQASKRGPYLILTGAGRSGAYARPGTPLVRDAGDSPDAAALERALSGKIFQTSTQARGRDGGVVGGRVRVALCADHTIAYDASDIGAVSLPGFDNSADLGSSIARRGEWKVVLFAGAPAVMAHWQGTGSSYALTAYFDLRPAANGKSVELGSLHLPLTGSC